ncbi:MAG: ribosomal L7Ae/L30e/S12e/Gadd45 family protein [Clostridia bacterium]
MLTPLQEAQVRFVGAKQVLRALSAGQLKCAYVARDADPFVTRRVIDACDKAKLPCHEVDTMQELGKACRIDVGAAAAAVGK